METHRPSSDIDLEGFDGHISSDCSRKFGDKTLDVGIELNISIRYSSPGIDSSLGDGGVHASGGGYSGSKIGSHVGLTAMGLVLTSIQLILWIKNWKKFLPNFS